MTRRPSRRADRPSVPDRRRVDASHDEECGRRAHQCGSFVRSVTDASETRWRPRSTCPALAKTPELIVGTVDFIGSDPFRGDAGIKRFLRPPLRVGQGDQMDFVAPRKHFLPQVGHELRVRQGLSERALRLRKGHFDQSRRRPSVPFAKRVEVNLRKAEDRQSYAHEQLDPKDGPESTW